MGSSAATSTAVCRALSGHLGVDLASNEISELVFDAEKIHRPMTSLCLISLICWI